MEAKHEDISRALRDEVISGRYGQEGRLPSESQLVKRFGVSRPTIARALRTLGEEGLIERRAGSGTFVKPSSQEAQSSTKVFSLLMPDFGNTEIFQLISGEIASMARVHDYSVMWSSSSQPQRDSDVSLQHGKELCEQFIEKRVAGVFFAPYELVEETEQANRWMAVKLREAGIPVVLLDRDLTSFPLRSDFDLVSTDNLAGGYLLGEHFIKLGCRDIRYVARPRSASTVEARIAGARVALMQHEVPVRREFVVRGDPGDLKFAKRLCKKLPEVFLCANDHTAAQLLQSLNRLGIRAPDDVRVAGFDDVKFATLVSPALTTIQQPCREIAQAAFRAMLERQSEPALPGRQISIAPRLVVRDSCGAYVSKTR